MAIPYIRTVWEDDITQISDERMNNIEETLHALASDAPADGEVPVWVSVQGKLIYQPGRGQANGLASLDASGKLPVSQLPAAGGGGGTPLVAGMGGIWFSNVAPAGWTILDGSTLVGAETLYPQLWANIDPGWKSGSNIVKPNLKGRIPIGVDPAQPEFAVLGQLSGAKLHTLTLGEIPNHNHPLNDPGHAHELDSGVGAGSALSRRDDYDAGYYTKPAYTGITIGAAGGGAAHNNLQPGIAVYWIMWLGGS